ncbi:metal-dependent hydrolase [Mangrovibacillus cuniculi]|uniref:Metal-dependent hydrolase n=1 Tax=Mangrovibacillus cuniculi TaxID=2593652 RepID=A0A7S8HFG7_9BACI|nr:metal-dependent hydrolase [Mangrovibacillus cuniculi]QPC46506.1 metal-dependent hydrolase [Mangrovibacillus cuniculi]
MNGTTHAVVGGTVGVSIGIASNVPTETTFFLASAGIVAALMPDIDTQGILANKLAAGKKLMCSVCTLAAICLGIMWFLGELSWNAYMLIPIVIGLIAVPPVIPKKYFVSGAGSLLAGIGIYTQLNAIIYLGVFILIGSLLPHRSYTHSILGLAFWGIISVYLELWLAVEQLMVTLVIAYASHLLLDSKYIPPNRRGIKLFLPFSNKNF